MTDSTINYRVRPRKNVERKMIADLLRDYLGLLGFPDFHYVGFGSYWFEDFLLFHRTLNIERMHSIEYPSNAARARFNRPLRCIEVLEGESTHALPMIEWSRQQSLVWLDYTADLSGPVFQDCEFLIQNLAPGSIILVTVNAHRRQLENNADSALPTKSEQLSILSSLVGDSLPARTSAGDLSLKRFPDTVSGCLNNFLTHALVSSGRELRFAPLVNARYSDNAPMVTVGGAIVDRSVSNATQNEEFAKKWNFLRARQPFEIDIPELTVREKLALDRLIPSGELSLKEEMERELGFSLKESAVHAYEHLYHYYPTFSEMHV